MKTLGESREMQPFLAQLLGGFCAPLVLTLRNRLAIFRNPFDHDKAQKSAISGCRLHWKFFEFSSVDFSVDFFVFLKVFYVI